ncbi:MAG: hypothetical protein K0R66_1508 [Gammaproteobacteria bacterium]|jgi:hypothetical protein|nr:hypothetical protein [Gammaproteobacteria bacterium]
MNITCQPADLIVYMFAAISTFRERMPQISDDELSQIKLAIEYQSQLLTNKKPKAHPIDVFDGMSLNELFSLVVRCTDCGLTFSQALAARVYDKIHCS